MYSIGPEVRTKSDLHMDSLALSEQGRQVCVHVCWGGGATVETYDAVP